MNNMKTFIYLFSMNYGPDEWNWYSIKANNREEADKSMIKHLIEDDDMQEKDALKYFDEENGELNEVIEIDHPLTSIEIPTPILGLLVLQDVQIVWNT